MSWKCVKRARSIFIPIRILRISSSVYSSGITICCSSFVVSRRYFASCHILQTHAYQQTTYQKSTQIYKHTGRCSGVILRIILVQSVYHLCVPYHSKHRRRNISCARLTSRSKCESEAFLSMIYTRFEFITGRGRFPKYVFDVADESAVFKMEVRRMENFEFRRIVWIFVLGHAVLITGSSH